MSKKHIKPIVLHLRTAEQQATHFFEREFNARSLESVKNEEGFYEIMIPSERFLVKDYLSESIYVQDLLDEFYGEEVKKDIEDLDEHELEEFEDFVIDHEYFQDWSYEDWYSTNEPMWGTVFECPRFYVDSEYMGIDKLKALGIGVIDHEDGYFLYISGAGYSFYDAHWIPLFRELGWIEEVDELPMSELERYKEGYEELICYFDSISDEEQVAVAARLEELGL